MLGKLWKSSNIFFGIGCHNCIIIWLALDGMNSKSCKQPKKDLESEVLWDSLKRFTKTTFYHSSGLPPKKDALPQITYTVHYRFLTSFDPSAESKFVEAMQPADSQNTTCITIDLHCTGSPACILLRALSLRSTTGRLKACFLLGCSLGENKEIPLLLYASFKFVASLGSQSYFPDVFQPSPLPNNFLTDLWVMVQVLCKGPLKNGEPTITWHGMRICTISCNQGYIKNCQSLVFQYKVLRWDHLNHLHSVADEKRSGRSVVKNDSALWSLKNKQFLVGTTHFQTQLWQISRGPPWCRGRSWCSFVHLEISVGWHPNRNK